MSIVSVSVEWISGDIVRYFHLVISRKTLEEYLNASENMDLASLKNNYFNNRNLLKNIVCSYHPPKLIASQRFCLDIVKTID